MGQKNNKEAPTQLDAVILKFYLSIIHHRLTLILRKNKSKGHD